MLSLLVSFLYFFSSCHCCFNKSLKEFQKTQVILALRTSWTAKSPIIGPFVKATLMENKPAKLGKYSTQVFDVAATEFVQQERWNITNQLNLSA